MCVVDLRVTLWLTFWHVAYQWSQLGIYVDLSRPYPCKTIRVSSWVCQHVKSVVYILRPCPWAGLVVGYVDAANLSQAEVPLERRHEGLIMGNGSVQNTFQIRTIIMIFRNSKTAKPACYFRLLFLCDTILTIKDGKLSQIYSHTLKLAMVQK